MDNQLSLNEFIKNIRYENKTLDVLSVKEGLENIQTLRKGFENFIPNSNNKYVLANTENESESNFKYLKEAQVWFAQTLDDYYRDLYEIVVNVERLHEDFLGVLKSEEEGSCFGETNSERN